MSKLLMLVVMIAEQASQPEQSTLAKHPIGNNRGLSQAYDIRDFASTSIMAFKDEKAKSLQERVAIAKAIKELGIVWKEASERIRILRGRPMPGSLRPEKKARKPKQDELTSLQETLNKLQ